MKKIKETVIKVAQFLRNSFGLILLVLLAAPLCLLIWLLGDEVTDYPPVKD